MLVYWFYKKNVRHILKYRRGNQNQYIGEKTDNTMTKLKKNNKIKKNTKKKPPKQWSTKHYIENYRSSNLNLANNSGMNFLEKVKTFCTTGGTRRVTLVEISHIVFVSKLHYICSLNKAIRY